MMNDLKQPSPTPKFGFLLDELHRQGFIVGVGDMLKVHRYFTSLWEYPVSAPLSIIDLKAQLAALVCQNPQQQKLFYAWFDKWASIIERRTENLIAQLEPLEAEKTGAKDKPSDTVEKTVEPPPPPPSTSETKRTANDGFTSAPSLKKRKGPINIQLAFPPNPIRFWNLVEFDTVLPVLREKKWIESTEWDIKTSIKRTIQSGGVPKFALKQKRQTPQYLMLIEQQSVRDHLAAFYAELAEELSRRDLNVAFYYYDITPALCWRERNNPKTHVPLAQLQGEYADARLFIVGHPETLLKPAQLEPSMVALSIWETWKETAILNPRSTGDWGKAELAIGQLFPVIPANGLGFQSLTAQWQGTEHFTPTYWQINSPEPRTPNVSEFIVSERLKAENTEGVLSLPSWKTITSEDENQLNLLYFYLRDGGYRWLCAAALYPEIYYELTRLYADEVIAKNQQLSEWEQNRLWGESLRLLVRLDWFRKGNIPTHWRGLLRDDFSMERAMALNKPQFTESVKEVRRQLLEVLKLPANTEGVPDDSYAAANQAFTQVWIESEMANNLADIPQKMTELEISMSDIEDAVGRQLWFLEGQKMEQTDGLTKIVRVACVDSALMESWEDFCKKQNISLELKDIKLSDIQFVTNISKANYVLNTEASRMFIASANAPIRPLVKMIDNTDIEVAFYEVIEQLQAISHWESVKAQKSQVANNMLLDNLSINFTFKGKSENLMKVDKVTCPILTYQWRADYELNVAQDLLSIKIVNNHPTATMYISGLWLSEVFGIDTNILNDSSRALSIEPTKSVGVFGESFNLLFAKNIFHDKWASFDNYLKIYVSTEPFEVTQFRQVDLEHPRKSVRRGDETERIVKKSIGVDPQIPQWAIKTIAFEMDVSTLTGVSIINEAIPVENAHLSKKAKKGAILIHIPEKMELNKETNCVIRIGYDEELLKKESFENATIMTDIELEGDISLDLFDNSNTPAFEIEGESQRQQTIPKDGFVEWVFEVQPLREKNPVLTLKIQGENKIEGEKGKPDILTERLIEVIKAEEGKRAVVNVEAVNVYEDTSVESEIVNRRTMGDVVFVSEIRENWGLIGENQWVDIQNLGVNVKQLDAEALKTLISTNNIDTALNNFKKWADTEGLEKGLKNTIVILQSRYVDLTHKENTGILSMSDSQIERNRIVNALLLLIDENSGEKIIPFSSSLSNPYERSTAYLLIDLPNEMAVHTEVECRVSIGFDKDALLEKDSVFYDKQIEEIEIANFMSVELTTTTSGRTEKAQALKKVKQKAEPSKFDIVSLTAKEQLIDRTEIVEWVFKCTSKVEGKFVLILDIKGGDGQNSYKQIASFDKRIEVQNRNNQYQTFA
jgi:Effector-associated domain 11